MRCDAGAREPELRFLSSVWCAMAWHSHGTRSCYAGPGPARCGVLQCYLIFRTITLTSPHTFPNNVSLCVFRLAATPGNVRPVCRNPQLPTTTAASVRVPFYNNTLFLLMFSPVQNPFKKTDQQNLCMRIKVSYLQPFEFCHAMIVIYVCFAIKTA